MQRERWKSRGAFILAAIGSAVGLGNLWRFPYIVYKNGGGAFFIPYFVALLTAGIPIMILEYGIGQMMQASPPYAFRKVNKNYEWLGWFAIFTGSIISFYYAVIMAYSWLYLYHSFTIVLPWTDSAKDFFFNKILGLDVKHNPWEIRGPIVIGLLITWISVFFIIHKGVIRVGKVVMITVPLPIILLIILAIRGLTLEGAVNGIEFYLKPDFKKLWNISTWIAAYGQIFFSLSLGFGILISYASYRPQDSDVVNNAFITSFSNCLTSFLAGFSVFSVLGFMAYITHTDVSKVVASGPSLAFITYPTAITKLAEIGKYWPMIISILFFITLISLGIDSLFSIVEAVVATFQDKYPKINRTFLTFIICAFSFIMGLIFTTRSGLAWIDIIDHWVGTYGLCIVGFLEVLVIGYFFNTEKLKKYINKVSEIHLGGWWELCIKLITPVILGIMIFKSVFEEINTPYGVHDWPLYICQTGIKIMAFVFIISFLISKKWIHLGLLSIGLILYIISRRFLSIGASISCAIAGAILLGGLIICINIALKGKDIEHHIQTYEE